MALTGVSFERVDCCEVAAKQAVGVKSNGNPRSGLGAQREHEEIAYRQANKLSYGFQPPSIFTIIIETYISPPRLSAPHIQSYRFSFILLL